MVEINVQHRLCYLESCYCFVQVDTWFQTFATTNTEYKICGIELYM